MREALTTFSARTIQRTDDTYTAVADTVTYDPTGKKCDLSELLDSNKADELEKEIANAPISEEEKRFLRKAAARHLPERTAAESHELLFLPDGSAF